MNVVRPPIAADVAAVIGDYAERVENRSLLLNKFVLHKSWPVIYADRSPEPFKWDDASRWSFIRLAQNGESVLTREEASQKKLADGTNATEENRMKARLKVEAITHLKNCACRQLPSSLSRQKIQQNLDLAEKLAQRPGQNAVLFGALEGRLIVNLSDSLIQNAGICLDRNTGIPYLPGSAVKGVCRHVALAALREGRWTIDEFMTVFGSSEVDFREKGELAAFASQVKKEKQTCRGRVDFLSANPVTEPTIEVDISTVHHAEYYGSGVEADLAKEGPKPNSFPVVATGVRYAFCLTSSDSRVTPELFAKAQQTLREAMTVHGFGAKTGAGYGWFRDVTEDVKKDIRQRLEREQKEAAAKQAAEEEAKRAAEKAARAAELANLSPAEQILAAWTRAGNLKAIVNGPQIQGFAKLTTEQKTAVVEALRQPEGLGHDVWMVVKGAVSDKKLLKLRNQQAESEIRCHYKTMVGPKGKMP